MFNKLLLTVGLFVVSCIFNAADASTLITKGGEDHHHLASCGVCNTDRCETELHCNGGSVLDICNCCPVCARLEGQSCGGQGNKYGTCDKGLYCADDKRIEGGICQGSGCHTPLAISNGYFRFTESPRWPQKICRVEYSCNLGYRLKGHAFVYCFHRHWVGKRPECEELRCPSLIAPGNGSMTFVKNQAPAYLMDSIVQFSCDEGYELIGDPTLACLFTEEWSGEVPTCKAEKCEIIDDCPMNQVYQNCGTACPLKCGFNDPMVCIEECIEGCACPPELPYMTAIGNCVASNDECRAACQLPSDSGECNANVERWFYSSEAGECQQFTYGGCEGNDNHFVNQVECYRSCQDCPHNQIWSEYYDCQEFCFQPSICQEQDEPEPQCKCPKNLPFQTRDGHCVAECPEVPCPVPPIEHGSIRCISNANGAVVDESCVVECNSGFRADIAYVTCDYDRDADGDGDWYHIPTCQDINECEHNNGGCENAQCINTAGGYSCNCTIGYTGEKCDTPVTCSPEHSTQAHGTVGCSGNTFSDTCSFTCDDGYGLSGEQILTCISNGNDEDEQGQWDSPKPSCEAVTCEPAYGSLENGNVNCTGNTFGEGCDFKCNTGYQRIGEATLTCGSDGNDEDGRGQWDNSAPSCEAITCEPAYESLENGNVDCTGNTFGEECSFTCNGGYGMIGEATLTCVSDGNDEDGRGQWDSSLPTCQGVTCNEPVYESLENGNVDCTGNTFGEECSFTCNSGYALRGVATLTCGSDGNDEDGLGQWDNSPPTCEAVTCEPLSLENGIANCTGDTFGEECKFTCNTGYQRRGGATLTCTESGRWDNPAPTCEAVTCDRLESLENGIVDCTGNTFGEECSFTCNTGYQRIGEATLTCGSDGNDEDGRGTWDSSLPTCQAVTCEPAYESLENGIVDCTGNTFGEGCDFTCNTGYQMRGEATLTCGSDGNDEDGLGTWDNSAPTCEAVRCEPLHESLKDGNVFCDDNTFGEECNFKCKNGFGMIGEATLTCVSDGNDEDGLGRWDNSAPTCQAITCTLYESLENGIVDCTGNTFGEECSFTCNTGYQRIGEATLTCGSDGNDDDGRGQWDSSLPTCQAVTCEPAYESLENGNVNCTGNTFGEGCDFTCNRGYEMIGAAHLTCSSDGNDGSGQWNSSAPTCEAVTCEPAYESLENGNVDCTGNTFGEECSFTCNTGYQMIGEATLTCTESGRWDNSVPTCEDINECDADRSPCSGPNDRCEDLPGSYRCVCDMGYERNSSDVCVDIDECHNNSTLCPEHQICLNTIGGYNCENSTCANTHQFDIMLVLDESASVSSENYEKVKQFSIGMVESYRRGVDSGDIKVGVITFDEFHRYRISMQPYTFYELRDEINNMEQEQGTTEIALAIEFATEKFLDASTDPDRRKVMLVVTDGRDKDNRDPAAAANVARENDIIVLALGVGSQINHNQILGIAGNNEKLVLELNDFDELVSYARKVSDIVCARGCEMDPCMNGATCLETEDEGFNCTCTKGYKGKLCSQVIVKCPIPSIENGRMTCSNRKVGEACSVSCDTGYTPGYPSVTCGDDTDGDDVGEWDHTATCRPVTCNEVHVENGNSTCTGNTEFGGACNFSCDNRFFRLNGPVSTLMCISDGSDEDGLGMWNDTAPTCEDIDECAEGTPCNDLEDCDNGIFPYSCTCKDGYQRDNVTQSCTDIDECDNSALNDCQNNGACLNFEGAFRCADQRQCHIVGDPHYRTFDGQYYSFQGDCRYTAVATKLSHDTHSKLKHFVVETENEFLNGNRASVFKEASIKVDHLNLTIIFHRQKEVWVNGIKVTLPFKTRDRELEIEFSGSNVVMSTNFGLEIAYNGAYNFFIRLWDEYANQVNGLCGNNNGNPDDDFNGFTSQELFALNNTVRADASDSRCGESPLPPTECADHDRNRYLEQCSILNDTCFHGCNKNISADEAIQNCVFDLCVTDGSQQSLQQAIEAYATECLREGYQICDWLNGNEPECGANAHYLHEGTACPNTCMNPSANLTCTRPHVSGCVCNKGYLLSGDECVLESDCGCYDIDSGLYFKNGYHGLKDISCQYQCNCTGSSGLSPLTCTFYSGCQDCQVINGVPECLDDNCSSEPCQNGGTCIVGEDTYTCNCPEGYIGVNCERESKCTSASNFNLMLVLNGSLSAREENMTKEFIRTVTRAFQAGINSRSIKIGVIRYAGHDEIYHIPMQNYSYSYLDGAISGMNLGIGGRRANDTAIRSAAARIDETTPEADKKKVMIIITDGNNIGDFDLDDSIKTARDNGTIVLAVVVGEHGARDGNSELVFRINEFSALVDHATNVSEAVCKPACSYNLCQNGATCDDTADSFVCHCPDKFYDGVKSYSNYAGTTCSTCALGYQGEECMDKSRDWGHQDCVWPFKWKGQWYEDCFYSTYYHDGEYAVCSRTEKFSEQVEKCHPIQRVDLN